MTLLLASLYHVYGSRHKFDYQTKRFSVAGTSTDDPVNVSRNTSGPIPCRKGFFREKDDEKGPCFPHCEKWKEYSDSEVIGTDVVILGSAVIGVVAGLAVIVISIVRFKRM